MPLYIPVRGSTCISTPTTPRNHHKWSLQRLVLLCITSSAYHFHAYSHPLDTCLTPSKVKDIKEIWDPDCNSIWAIAYNFICIAKKYPVSLLRFIMKISIKTKRFTIVDLILLHSSYSISIVLTNSNKIKLCSFANKLNISWTSIFSGNSWYNKPIFFSVDTIVWLLKVF